MPRSRIGWFTMVFAAALLCGCGTGRKPVYPVKGQVLINGKPAAGATVFFNPVESAPDAIAPFGVTDPSGSFALSTYLTFDGAPAGEYVVTIRAPGPPQNRDEDQGPDRLRSRYNDPKTSKLRVTVEKKANDLQPFQLSTK